MAPDRGDPTRRSAGRERPGLGKTRAGQPARLKSFSDFGRTPGIDGYAAGMKIAQYVVRRDPRATAVGRIVAVRKHAHGHCDSAGSRYIVRVYWLVSGHRSTHSGAQLKVLCPTCAGEDAEFGDDQAAVR